MASTETSGMALQQYSHVKPQAGLVLEAYVSRNDVGSGLRMFIVYRVGHKWIHVIYPPDLTAFRIRPSTFHAILKRPLATLDETAIKARIRGKLSQMQRFGMQTPGAAVETLLNTPLKTQLADFQREPKRKPSTRLPIATGAE